MGFKEKFSNVMNKMTDAVVDASIVYEKVCMDATVFSLADIRKSTDVKVKIDENFKIAPNLAERWRLS